MGKYILLISLAVLLAASGSYAQSNSGDTNESRFGVNLGSLSYNSAVNHIRELGNIYVRNGVWGDLYGWKKVKIKKGSHLILASKELCEKYCDAERSSSDPNNPQPKSYYCESGQLYFCRPSSREGLIEGMPPLADFYENPNNLPFEWFVSVATSRYDKKPPKNFLAGTYPYGNEDTYKGYIEYLVKRLGDKVKYWEIGNENDGAAFWAGTPKEYTDMLVIASEEIKKNCADCKVGISFAHPGLSPKFPDRIKEWYLAMGKVCDSFDFIDAHFYSPSFIKPGELDTWKKICPGKEFISTESGIPDNIHKGKPQNAGGSLTKQAQDLIKYNTLLFAEGYSKIYWFLMDTEYGMGEIFLHNGLIDDVDNSRKPAFYSYKTMINKVDYFTSITKLAEGQYKYTFSNKNPVYVLWCDSGTCLLPPGLTGEVKVTDYLGNEEIKYASQITLGESPVFVEEK
jgi:hypothetical protein